MAVWWVGTAPSCGRHAGEGPAHMGQGPFRDVPLLVGNSQLGPKRGICRCGANSWSRGAPEPSRRVRKSWAFTAADHNGLPTEIIQWKSPRRAPHVPYRQEDAKLLRASAGAGPLPRRALATGAGRTPLGGRMTLNAQASDLEHGAGTRSPRMVRCPSW